MSTEKLEAFLARLYTDVAFRAAFLAAPRATAQTAGLDANDTDALAEIDREGLELAARSYDHKRSQRAQKLP